MTVCVGSTDEWREAGKIGLRAQRLAYILHTPSPHDYTIQTFFFTTQWAVFSPCVFRELCKWWRDPFFFLLWPNEEKIEVREMPPLFFFSPPPHSACEPFMSAVWARGFSSAAMWKDDGGCSSRGRGRVSAQWHTRRAEEAARKRMLALLLDGLTLINEREKDREKIRREGWHWYSRPAWGSWTLVRRGERLRKSPRLHCWSGRG